MSTAPEERETARMYTGGRRINILFGKLPNGGRIPGGPYTGTQLAAGGVVLVVGWMTMSLWGPMVGPPLVRIAALLFAFGLATFFSGKIPATKRKLPDLALDGFNAATAASFGTYRGKSIRVPAPHQATGTVLMQLELESPEDVHPVVAFAPQAAAVQPGRLTPLLAIASQAPVSGVQRLLAQVGQAGAQPTTNGVLVRTGSAHGGDD
jgi:hypothetical protein